MEVRGRGTSSNPRNRFERTAYETSEWDEPGDPHPQTVFLKDETRSIINYNDSPDVGFNASISIHTAAANMAVFIALPGPTTNISAFPPASISNRKSLSKKTHRNYSGMSCFRNAGSHKS